MIKKTSKRIISVVIALAVIISGAFFVPAAEVHAASAPGQIWNLKIKNIRTYEATVRWGKASGNVSGYAIYRNGKVIKRVDASTFSYRDKDLKASKSYNYYVRAYTYTGKTIRKWYNTETKKWQKTKPPKEIRGKSRLVKVRKYGKASPDISIRTSEAFFVEGREMLPKYFRESNNYTYKFIKEGTQCPVCKIGTEVTVKYDKVNDKYTWSSKPAPKNCEH